MKKKVLIIGWDAADWNIINPLLDQGKLPALAGLIKKGVKGNLSTMNPPYSPMLWTSVATGKTPDKHGVLGFIEIDTVNQLVKPVTSTQRKVRAIWNILHSQGMKSNLIGWWPTHPAEPINGFVVSDLFPKPIGPLDKEWAVAPKSVHPTSVTDKIQDLRIHPNELTGAHILPFIPKAAEIDEKDQNSLKILTKILAHNSTIHACSTWAMENTEWDFTAVYYDMIDHMCHGFMNYHPPKLPPVSQKTYEIFKDAVNGAYLYQDMMLERTLELAGEDTLVIVMSDHGYVSGNDRMLVQPDIHAAPALEHREFGMFVMSGPGIKKNETIYGTSLLDITPTLLNYLDLPVGRDMDGRVMHDAFISPKTTNFINSWETEPGDFGEHNTIESGDALSQQAAMEQLIELGYIDRPDINMEKAINETKNDLKFNLARVFLGKQDYVACKKILLELISESSKPSPYLVDLLHISIVEEEFKEARKYLIELRKIDPKAEAKTKLVEAKILIGENQIKMAQRILEDIAKRPSMSGNSHYELGKLFMRFQENEKALKQFEKAINVKPDNAKFQHAIATVQLKLNHLEDALDHALTSIELVRYFPDAHYTIGQILEKMGELESAKQAYATAKKLRPDLIKPKIAIENVSHRQSEKTENLRDTSEFPEITIVSGLPRSGTSMMMQMISSGGIPPLVDNIRKEDESNPKGYFEFEKTKSLHKNNEWLNEAEGKVLKVVAQLLKHLPSNYRYKIIFMTRDLDEVLTSQRVMLQRTNVQPKAGVRKSFEEELSRLDLMMENEPGMKVLKVSYSDVINNPKEQALRIKDFTESNLDISKMVEQVESNLYRNRLLK